MHCWLFYIKDRNQTTTRALTKRITGTLFYIKDRNQTTTMPSSKVSDSYYFTSKIEIKPQPSRQYLQDFWIILHQRSKSNHNNIYRRHYCSPIILHQRSKSNHNRDELSAFVEEIILHQRSKSNHNKTAENFPPFYIILHQRSKSNHN